MAERNKSIYVRVTENEKRKLKRQAEICNLSLSEYLRKVSLGFVPKAFPPDTFFSMTEKLTQIYQLCQGRITQKTEQKLIETITELNQKYLFPEKKKR